MLGRALHTWPSTLGIKPIAISYRRLGNEDVVEVVDVQQLAVMEVVAVPPSRTLSATYLLAALVALFAAVAVFGIAAVGTMMCAYFVPFHITHGPPVVGSVER